MADSSWAVVVGALGGVSITGALGLATAGFNRRWQTSDRKQDRADATAALRRDAYVRYLLAVEALDSSIMGCFLDPRWRAEHQPSQQSEATSRELFIAHRNAEPEKWDEHDAGQHNAQLVAGDPVRMAIDDYDQAVHNDWGHYAETGSSRESHADIETLVSAMRVETQPKPVASEKAKPSNGRSGA